MLSQKIIPSYYGEILKRQMFDFVNVGNIPFFLLVSIPSVVGFGIVLIYRSFRSIKRLSRLRFLDIVMAALLMPFLLELLILQKHYYPHYLQLFVPFPVVSAAFLLTLCLEQCDQISLGRKASFVTLSLLVLFLLSLIRVELFSSFWEVIAPSLDPRLAEYAVLTSSGKATDLSREGFLYPESMYLHWRLQEQRHGFPNPYNTLLINQGVWEDKIITLPYFRSTLPTTKREYCRMLVNKGPACILSHDLDIVSCLEGDLLRSYGKDQVIETPSLGKNPVTPLVIFKRRELQLEKSETTYPHLAR